MEEGACDKGAGLSAEVARFQCDNRNEGNVLSIQLDPEIEERIAALARRAGRSEDSCIRELITENIEDLEDRCLAEERLKQRRSPLTSQKVREELGLER